MIDGLASVLAARQATAEKLKPRPFRPNVDALFHLMIDDDQIKRDANFFSNLKGKVRNLLLRSSLRHTGGKHPAYIGVTGEAVSLSRPMTLTDCQLGNS